MSKIIDAAKKMTENYREIKGVTESITSDEYFFTYKGYKWSVRPVSDNQYGVYYYPGDISIQQLSQIVDVEWEDVDMVAYIPKRMGSEEQEASHVFFELYKVVKERYIGIDDVLDDIIGGD